MAVKSRINVEDMVNRHLNKAADYRLSHALPPKSSRKVRSGSEILTQLYLRMDNLLEEIDASDESPGRKAEAYGKVARIVQQLQKDERSAHVRFNDKAIEDMQTQEIEQLVQTLLTQRGGKVGGPNPASLAQLDFPCSDAWGGDNTNPRAKIEKQENEQVLKPSADANDDPPRKNKRQQAKALKGVEARRAKKARNEALTQHRREPAYNPEQPGPAPQDSASPQHGGLIADVLTHLSASLKGD